MAPRSVCVFCGSKTGSRPEYAAAAGELGRLLAMRGIRLVYGGGSSGLMGVIADASLGAGGEVVGVMPRLLVNREVAHLGLTKLHIVETMHERKALMADLSDAFVAMPGGIGTFDELFEIVTWRQIGFHSKPFAFLNVAGYYDPLLALADHAVTEGFLGPQHRAMLVSESDPARLLEKFSESRG